MSLLVENLRHLLAVHGLSENQLGALTGVDQSTINRILNGKTKDARDSTIQPLADFFRQTVDAMKRSDLKKVPASTLLEKPLHPKLLDAEMASRHVRPDPEILASALSLVDGIASEWNVEFEPADRAEFLVAAYEYFAEGKSFEEAGRAVRGMLRAFSLGRGRRVT